MDSYLPDRVVQVHKQLPAPGPLDRYIAAYTIVLTAEGKASATQLPASLTGCWTTPTPSLLHTYICTHWQQMIDGAAV